MKEYLFVRFPDRRNAPQPGVGYKHRPSPSSVSVFENVVQPAVEGLTPEPVWDLVVESYDTDVSYDSRATLLPVALPGGAWMWFRALREVVFDGPQRELKILSLTRRRDDLTAADFSEHYRTVHGALVAQFQCFRKHVSSYVQNLLVNDTVRVSEITLVLPDAISEFAAASADHALKAWISPDYISSVKPDEANFVLLQPDAVRSEDRKSPKLAAMPRRVY